MSINHIFESSLPVHVKGTVFKSTGSWYSVLLENGEMRDCRIRGKLKISGLKSTNPVAVGDHVEVDIREDGTGMINAVETRRNYIVRKATRLSSQTQIIASNMDQAVLMTSLRKPRTMTSFIDRFIVVAEAYSIPVVLFFNKTDIYSEKDIDEMEKRMQVYESIGYKCMHASVLKNGVSEEVRNIFKGKTTLITGQSGVGKSTLINAMIPGLDIRIGPVSTTYHRGRHTTTFAAMYPLAFGGHVIDTPGMKSFGVVDFSKDELHHYFREIFHTGARCRYHNCTHQKEPECAVRLAVEKKQIAEFRYYNYINILRSDDIKT